MRARLCTPSPALALALVSGVLALCVARLLEAPPAELHERLRMWTPVTYVLAGVVVWRRRPGILAGPALVLTGIGYGFGYLAFNLRQPVAYTAALVPAYWWVPILFAAFLAFPRRRLGRWDRVLVGLAALHWWVLQPFGSLFLEPRSAFCRDCPEGLNVLLVADEPAFGLGWGNWNLRWYLLLLVALVVTLVVRFARASSPSRRVLLPVTIPVVFDNLVGTTQIALEQLNVITGGTPVDDWTVDARIWMGLVAAVVTPLGIVLGARLEARRRDAAGRLAAATDLDVLQDGVRAALGDPGARIVAGTEGTGTPLVLGGEVVGWLQHDEAAGDDPRLLEAVTAVAALALGAQRRVSRLGAALDDVRASQRRLSRAGDEARRQVERELEHGALVELRAALVAAEDARSAAPPELHAAIDGLQDEVRRAMAELRDLVRGLVPPVLAEHGLAAALHELPAAGALPVVLLRVPDERLDPRVEAAAWFVVTEAIANAGKHAGATRVSVDAVVADGTLRVEVADDGRGGAARDGGGLAGLAERLADLGGGLALESPVDAGTRVVATLPVLPPVPA